MMSRPVTRSLYRGARSTVLSDEYQPPTPEIQQRQTASAVTTQKDRSKLDFSDDDIYIFAHDNKSCRVIVMSDCGFTCPRSHRRQPPPQPPGNPFFLTNTAVEDGAKVWTDQMLCLDAKAFRCLRAAPSIPAITLVTNPHEKHLVVRLLMENSVLLVVL
ncbi:hypothetical protein JOB18_008242 [Solea senegalensis]|uniref:Uncharacterized protein n=1 Tax=Solea senegalensis TaxID=28829 RepID=A0AAV6RPF9_SOLSE|nr:hypothetical protein JOB18_008242 [Solea senegalensis]